MKSRRANWLKKLAIALLVIGIFFRFANLDGKIMWHDEVYTNFRATGYTRTGIDQEIFQNRVLFASELQQYQQIKPNSTRADTLQSLITEDPQHPPLYFLLARVWMQIFGSSITADRLLPALISLISLPLMYFLALELFVKRSVALWSMALLALSPFDILFAQTARQYSLMTVTVIASSWLLLRALRLRKWREWGFYAIAVTVGFYAQPLFLLTPIAHGVYLLGRTLNDYYRVLPGKRSLKQTIRPVVGYAGAMILAIVLYLPWIRVLTANMGMASATTNWTRDNVGFVYLLKLWILSFTSLFIDLDFGFDNVVTYLLRIPFVLLIAAAFYIVFRDTRSSTWFFILTSFFVPFLMLALPDLITGGKRSAVSRYLISCYPAIQLAVGYLIATRFTLGDRTWRKAVLPIVAIASIVSCTVSAFSETWWNKDLSYFNAHIANYVNDTPNPVIVSDIGNDYTNTGDLVSLSYSLKPDTRLFLVSQPPDLSALKTDPSLQDATLLVFRSSEVLGAALQQEGWQVQKIDEPWKLGKLQLR